LIQAAGGCRGERAGPRGGGGAPGPGVMQVAGRQIHPPARDRAGGTAATQRAGL